ncbi:MAG TPA: disulfide oxidoreductase [Longimicrobiales bacterium]|nr:disulfide oxidoreductase [Longimicrobiales bacterium]
MFTVITTWLGGLALVAIAVTVISAVAAALPRGRARMAREVAGAQRPLLASAWLVAAIAMAGSLYFSDGVGLVPCLLCWYQRIAMYPLVVVLGIAVIRGDWEVWRYATPLAVIGLAISVYHVTIQLMPTLDVVTCSAEAPCTMRYLAIFGFVSIPFMAGSAFMLIITLLLAVRAAGRHTDESVAGAADSVA